MPSGGAPASTSSGGKIWIPVDVKIHWFSFLSVPDLARASRVCKSWTSLVQKTADAEITAHTGVQLPQLARPAKLRLLDRLHHAYLPENMAYLITWAAGCRGQSQARLQAVRTAPQDPLVRCLGRSAQSYSPVAGAHRVLRRRIVDGFLRAPALAHCALPLSTDFCHLRCPCCRVPALPAQAAAAAGRHPGGLGPAWRPARGCAA